MRTAPPRRSRSRPPSTAPGAPGTPRRPRPAGSIMKVKRERCEGGGVATAAGTARPGETEAPCARSRASGGSTTGAQRSPRACPASARRLGLRSGKRRRARSGSRRGFRRPVMRRPLTSTLARRCSASRRASSSRPCPARWSGSSLCCSGRLAGVALGLSSTNRTRNSRQASRSSWSGARRAARHERDDDLGEVELHRAALFAQNQQKQQSVRAFEGVEVELELATGTAFAA